MVKFKATWERKGKMRNLKNSLKKNSFSDFTFMLSYVNLMISKVCTNFYRKFDIPLIGTKITAKRKLLQFLGFYQIFKFTICIVL